MHITDSYLLHKNSLHQPKDNSSGISQNPHPSTDQLGTDQQPGAAATSKTNQMQETTTTDTNSENMLLNITYKLRGDDGVVAEDADSKLIHNNSGIIYDILSSCDN